MILSLGQIDMVPQLFEACSCRHLRTEKENL